MKQVRPTILSRRDLFRASVVASASLGLNLLSPEIFRRRLSAAPGDGKKKLIFIFQRGGNDGVNTCIPRGDPEYNTTNRPNLFIPDTRGLDLGNGFAQLHPAMAQIMSVYNRADLTGMDGPGNLAILHRIGYSGQSQSHFASQRYWENGMPGQPYSDEGIFYRKVTQTLNPTENRFAAAAISDSQMVALKGPDLAIPTLTNPSRYTFSGARTKVQKLLGGLPTGGAGGSDGSGLLGLYGGPHDFPGKPFRNTVYETGLSLVDSINIVQDAVQQGYYRPDNGAIYPGDDFGQQLRTAAMLMKRTPVQILGVNIDGWDLHTNQGAVAGSHTRLLSRVAQGYRALYLDLQDQWDDTIVVSMTEFGRTSKENGSYGTDHAFACVMLVAGGAVKGGVYNCDSSTWAKGDMFSQDDRYISPRTDYRAVLGEIFRRHFGDDMATVRQIIPSYQGAASANPGHFTPLNFLPA